MSTTHDTPRTDRFDCCYVNGKHARLVPSNFARELERELAHERAKVAELVAALDTAMLKWEHPNAVNAELWLKWGNKARAALAHAKETNQ